MLTGRIAAVNLYGVRGGFTYFDFVSWQQAPLRGGRLRRCSVLLERLSRRRSAILELPLDRPRPARQTYKFGRVSQQLPANLRASVTAIAQRLRITEFALHLAVYYLLLQRLTGQRDLVVGIDVYGRDSEHFKDVAGFFVNQLALRCQVAADSSRSGYLQQVDRMALRSLSFQEMPFEKVVDDLQIERETAYSPLFQVKFLFHGETRDPGGAEGLRVWSPEAFEGQSQYDATLEVFPEEIRLHYNPDLFLDTTVRGWPRPVRCRCWRSALGSPIDQCTISCRKGLRGNWLDSPMALERLYGTISF